MRDFHMYMEPLVGPRIQLRPMLASDGHELVQAASDGDLWNSPYTMIPSAQTAEQYIRVALEGRGDGSAIPFVIQILEPKRMVIGSTRFWNINWQHRHLEIGWTWIGKSWQRTFVNTEAKFLMLSFAFERLNCVRVQFTTDEMNKVSTKAIERLGAQQEGILRHDYIMPDGRKRDSAVYSILDEEWPDIKRMLEEKLRPPAEETEGEAAAAGATGAVARSVGNQ